VARDSKPEAKPMQFHKGWSYETRKALYQLWPPDPSPRVDEPRTDWTAGWTERREPPVSYLDDEDDEDDGWRPEVVFAHGTTAEQALACFPTSEEAAQAKKALLRAAHARKSFRGLNRMPKIDLSLVPAGAQYEVRRGVGPTNRGYIIVDTTWRDKMVGPYSTKAEAKKVCAVMQAEADGRDPAWKMNIA
jgi:hypothetical protein